MWYDTQVQNSAADWPSSNCFASSASQDSPSDRSAQYLVVQASCRIQQRRNGVQDRVPQIEQQNSTLYSRAFHTPSLKATHFTAVQVDTWPRPTDSTTFETKQDFRLCGCHEPRRSQTPRNKTGQNRLACQTNVEVEDIIAGARGGNEKYCCSSPPTTRFCD